ncbi:MAG: tetratricopeptide repeat protein, partial [Hyphomicrobiaceae bacterium]|nr:tetratricopeptide repeat protein [Hyphomicrobiaceae bacterium]
MTGKNKLETLLDSALQAEKRGDLDDAEENLRALLQDKPRHPDAAFLLGVLCLRRGRAREAVDLLQTALAAAGRQGRIPDPSWRIAYAQALGETGDFVGALSEISSLAGEFPGDRDVAELHGQMLEKLGRNAQMLQKVGRHEEAIADFTEYLRCKPDDPRALTGLGESLLALGRTQSAADAFVRACEAEQSFTPALFKASQALLQSGRTVDA